MDTLSLEQQIALYEHMQQQLKAQMFRVVSLSDRYLMLVFFSTDSGGIETEIIDSNRIPKKAIGDLYVRELTKYTEIMQALERWAEKPEAEFPIVQDVTVMERYRSLM